MSMIRQSLLMRTDLEFPIGLLAAQVAHLHGLPLISQIQATKASVGHIKIPALHDWVEEPYLFVHAVPNHEVLMYLIDKAEKYKVPVLTWHDTVNIKIGDETVPFEQVLVGVSLGPYDSDKIRMVIGALPLL